MGSIKRRKLADAVIEEIIRMLQNGELKEGDKLPNQNEFAAQLGVSRPSLREALHTLNLLGVIEQRPGFGTVIRSVKPAAMIDRLTPPLVSDTRATLELVEARRFIELSVVELAVRNAVPEDVEKMGALVEEMGRALENGRMEEYSDLDTAFHYQIGEASHNRFMVHTLVTLRGMMEQFMRETFSVLPGLYERSYKFHREIYEGIMAGDLKRASGSMKKHIDDIEKALLKYYEVSQRGRSERSE